jgi:HAD superfamily hydrolase (TIGR01458 family)
VKVLPCGSQETFNLPGDATEDTTRKTQPFFGVPGSLNVRGVLIDLDGVLYLGGSAIPGACQAIDFLKKNGVPFRCISNTTRKCRKTICLQLSAMGFAIAQENIFTPPLAAIAYMKTHKKTRFHLLTTGDVDEDFREAGTQGSKNVDYVIVGDAGDAMTYGSMNTAFRLLTDGAELIALEKDRYWMVQDGLSLAAWPFVSALEFATGKTAVIMGKPSKDFFDLVLKDLHLPPADVAMIGDDLFTDVGGAQKAGMTGVLVRTGKFRKEILQTSPIIPDAVINSIADIQDIL